MNDSDIKDAIYITKQAREAWLSSLTLDKSKLKAVSIGLNGFLREMKESDFLKHCFTSADLGMLKMFIADTHLYNKNDKCTLETNFATAQRIFDEAIIKLENSINF